MKIVLIISLGIFIASCSTSLSNEPNKTSTDNKPTNIILMIGDGMGLTQISAGYYANNRKLSLEEFKSIGLVSTHSKSHLITDSAAGATAMATGHKTANLMISQTMEDSTDLKTIMEYAEENGLATGIVATCAFTHATPAAFFGHQPNRNYVNEALAVQFLNSGVDVLIAGGKNYFTNRSDSINLYPQLKDKGYAIIDSLTQKGEWEKSDKLLCMIAPEHPDKVSALRDKNYLQDATLQAIRTLKKNKKGFLLMVEGSQIDWGGHANDSDYIISEMLDFNKAIKAALEFAKKY